MNQMLILDASDVDVVEVLPKTAQINAIKVMQPSTLISSCPSQLLQHKESCSVQRLSGLSKWYSTRLVEDTTSCQQGTAKDWTVKKGLIEKVMCLHCWRSNVLPFCLIYRVQGSAQSRQVS